MIRHIVFFSANSLADVETIFQTLSGYAQIPGVLNFEVARNRKIDGLGNEVDIILHACFESDEALAAYKAHPIYIAGIAKVRPLRELRIAADYLTPRAWGSEWCRRTRRRPNLDCG